MIQKSAGHPLLSHLTLCQRCHRVKTEVIWLHFGKRRRKEKNKTQIWTWWIFAFLKLFLGTRIEHGERIFKSKIMDLKIFTDIERNFPGFNFQNFKYSTKGLLYNREFNFLDCLLFQTEETINIYFPPHYATQRFNQKTIYLGILFVIRQRIATWPRVAHGNIYIG